METKECPTCKTLKESSPTPDGDEICPNCGNREMMDYEQDLIDLQEYEANEPAPQD